MALCIKPKEKAYAAQIKGKVKALVDVFEPEFEPAPDATGTLFRVYRVPGHRLGIGIRSMCFFNNYVKASNPQTPAQQANRGKFADAVAAWHDLSEAEKSEYNEKGKLRKTCRKKWPLPRGMSGINLFVSEYRGIHG